jgi:branched-chain amino acid transport system substrate-binding protein
MNKARNLKSLQAVFLVLLVSILACSQSPLATPAANATIAPPTNTPAPTNTPIPPPPTNTPFVPKATLKIAVHLPMTGDSGGSGTDIFHASELAVDQLSNPLELMGYDVELVSYDDKSDVDTAVKNAKELVADADILCGVGHFYSYITIQTTEVYHKAGLAFISPSATHPDVTDRGYLEVNRVIGREDGQGMAGAQFAYERGFKAIYIIYNKDSFKLKNADYFKRESGKLGLSVVGELATDVSDNFEDVIKRILEANTDLVYFAGFDDQVGNFVNQARELGYTGAVLGTDATPEVLNYAGLFAIDGGGLYYTNIGANLASLPNATQFGKDFLTRFGGEPQIFSSYAYDATGICMKAIEEASKAKGGDVPTRAEVANSIRALVDYQGITGTYNFNSKGDPIVSVYQVTQVTTIDPNKWGSNPVVATYEIELPGK